MKFNNKADFVQLNTRMNVSKNCFNSNIFYQLMT